MTFLEDLQRSATTEDGRGCTHLLSPATSKMVAPPRMAGTITCR